MEHDRGRGGRGMRGAPRGRGNYDVRGGREQGRGGGRGGFRGRGRGDNQRGVRDRGGGVHRGGHRFNNEQENLRPYNNGEENVVHDRHDIDRQRDGNNRQQHHAHIHHRHHDIENFRPQPDEQPPGVAPPGVANHVPRNGNRPNADAIRRIRARDLEDMKNREPADLLMDLNNVKTGFISALGDGNLLERADCVSNLIICIGKALQCEYRPAVSMQLLNNIRTSAFIRQHISLYFAQMMTQQSNAIIRSYKQPIKDSLTLFNRLLRQFPNSLPHVQIAYGALTMAANDLRPRSNVIDEDIDEALQLTKQLLDEIVEQQRAEKHVKNQTERPVNQPPPNNFRDMTVFPDLNSDIHCKGKPFLREIIKKGRFEDAEHYLDVQFRLLREDFIRPLRNGILQYLDLHAAEADGMGAGRRSKLIDVRVYHNVFVLNPVCTPNGIRYRIRFDISRLQHVKWRFSKRLIYGSLLCLSSDDFNTFRIATVSDRNPEKLKDGLLEVCFEAREADDIPPDERFVMLETSAYFEAYRHVLTALQATRQADIPFLENIVLCEPKVNPPQYLLTADEPYFDLRAIAGVTDDRDDLDLPEGEIDLQYVPILIDDQWPSASALHLDDSQLKALKTALTRRLSIIQGPPGTGKTYIGLKIVQTLLDNSSIWNDDVDPDGVLQNSPILVVCYTNHALDQFLEGMNKFLKTGIVRVGGRSKSTEMQKFLLKEQRKKCRDNRDIPRRIFLERVNAHVELDRLRAEIERQAAFIEATDRGLVHEEVLHEFIREELFDSLMNYAADDDQMNYFGLLGGKRSTYGPSVLPVWLGLFEMIAVDTELGENENVVELVDLPGAELAANVPDIEEDVENEVQAIEEERRLEVADDNEAQRILAEQQRQQRNIERADEQLAVNFDNIQNAARPAVGNDEKWTEQRDTRKKRRHRLLQRLHCTDMMTDQEAEQVDDVWNLKVDDRWKLYRYWVSEYIKRIREDIVFAERDFQIAANSLKEILEREDGSIMRKMKVIGMTTTGAARYINTLREIKPKIVIVEEAAEVLEAHVVTTLSGGCEHLILIGDHQQLRPSTQVYELAEKYNLKYSLFERLVTNELDHVTLTQQHRMRPEIADVMRLFYDHLADDDSVKKYENIKGVARNIFFINHAFHEQKDDELKSVSNQHEAQFIAALGNYLVLQGYSSSQITILTPYIGQVFLLRRLVRDYPTLEGVHVCPIDNFQGEENDIILFSFVRSNDDRKIGFLQEDNRICVALSRAKKGFYAIGNFDQFAVACKQWSKVVARVKKGNAFGNSLQLCCQNHPNKSRIEAQSAKDFNKAPEGGCLRQCEFRLPCGHACDRVCHPYDRDHTTFKCQKPCTKVICHLGHKCPRYCHQKCGPCMEPVRKQLPCGHQQMVPCGDSVNDFRCREKCDRRLPCGHNCQNLCGDDCTTECRFTAFKHCPKGHRFIVKCCEKEEITPCKEPCGTKLDCSHVCIGTCGTCHSGRLHAACAQPCSRILVCDHECAEPCTKECPPCRRQCENRCKHSRCPRECGRPCQPCQEMCLWQCQHYSCTKLCCEPCDRPRCDNPCTMRLSCGHPCIGMCGETCPDKCRVCNRAEVTEIFFGTEEEPDARFVQLEDCGHVLEVTGLDRWMDEAVDKRSTGAIQLKKCPRCKTTIRRNLRYGTIINAVLHDIELVKQKMIGKVKKSKVTELSKRAKSLKQSESFTSFYLDRLSIVGITETELTQIENIFNFLENVNKLQSTVRGKGPEMKDVAIKRSILELSGQIEIVRRWLLDKRARMTSQELNECHLEIRRLNILFRFYEVENRMKTREFPLLAAEKKQSFKETLSKLMNSKMTEALCRSADEVFASTMSCLTGLGVTEQERLDIVKAMGMGNGHWFKCPNGHYYAIADCGGAMEEGRCGECNARIGGASHALRPDNSFAPEVDDARAPAWPGMDMNRPANN